MKNAKKLWRKQALTAAVLGMLAIGGVPVAAEAAQVAAETATATTASLVAPIEQVTGIAKTYGDGEFVEWAVVRYDVAMDPASVEPGDFSIDGQTIDEVRVGATADVPEKSHAGRPHRARPFVCRAAGGTPLCGRRHAGSAAGCWRGGRCLREREHQ